MKVLIDGGWLTAMAIFFIIFENIWLFPYSGFILLFRDYFYYCFAKFLSVSGVQKHWFIFGSNSNKEIGQFRLSQFSAFQFQKPNLLHLIWKIINKYSPFCDLQWQALAKPWWHLTPGFFINSTISHE